MVSPIELTLSTRLFICEICLPVCSAFCSFCSDWVFANVIDCTVSLAADSRRSRTSRISVVADAVLEARARTSSATTAKPRPCSPARAASIAAFRASRFVCSAMAEMTSRMVDTSPVSRTSRSTRSEASRICEFSSRELLMVDSTIFRLSADSSRVSCMTPLASLADWLTSSIDLAISFIA